jgi:hypothetical protein
VLTGQQHQYIGAVQRESKCSQHHAYLVKTLPIQSAGVSGKGNRIIQRLQLISETKERRSPQCELKTKHLPSS